MMFKRNFKFGIAVVVAVVLSCKLTAQSNTFWKMQPVDVKTRWAKEVNPDSVFQYYPRPQMVRENWQNLNGLWDYVITSNTSRFPKEFSGKILVPYPIESALSGVKKALLPDQVLWYRRHIISPKTKGKRVLLHFGAIDYQATIFLNGIEIGNHSGGYQSFSFDITNALRNGNNELIVKVIDPTDQGPNPHGKQVLRPQNILYTASSGIWQTVWLETVPVSYISKLIMTPSIDSGNLKIVVNMVGDTRDYTVIATSSNGSSIQGQPGTQLLLTMHNAHLWSPESPYLYGLNVRLLYKGNVVDTVGSYFGMRKIEVRKDEKGVDRIFLNNNYTFNLGVLDQGFWPEGLYTPPTDDALKFDILAIKNMGFNTIRKHVKLEPDRWYYYADCIGMLVWQDMVTCAGDSPDARREFEKENNENVSQLYNHPSIIVWVLFNEGWASYDQKRLTEWMKKLDPSRIINGHTGENYDRSAPQNLADKWASSDLTDIHDYPGPGIAPALPGKARVLGEWGGIRVAVPHHQWNPTEGWGYIQLNASEFERKYEFMLKHLEVYEEEGLSGSIYTEPFDVETEENGLMSYDREVIKIPAEKLRQIHKRLVPAAERYVWGAFDAQKLDTTSLDRRYTSLLVEYKRGRRDSNFLYDLAIMAMQVSDTSIASIIAGDYIKEVKNPYVNKSLNFILKFTEKTTDPGFAIFLKSPAAVNEVLGENFAEHFVRGMIGREEIDPYLKDKKIPVDWDRIISDVKRKFGELGEEKVYGAQMVYYLEKEDWVNFEKYYVLYYLRAYSRSEYHINNMTWPIFEHTHDPQVLSVAINTMKYSLQNFDQNNSAAYDTYANLLYKVGRKQEAIAMEEIAVKLSNNGKEFMETLGKMEKGIPTWN